MARYIDIDKTAEQIISSANALGRDEYGAEATLIAAFLRNQPTEDVVPANPGRWIRKESVTKTVDICSNCGEIFDERIIPFRYCPNCGSRNRL